MNGWEHYQVAEELLAAAREPSISSWEATRRVERATVHAHLAEVAARIDSAYELAHADEWVAAIHRKKEPQCPNE